MARVTGVGGFFFRAREPDALAGWYTEHLGIPPPAGNYEDPGWFTDRGETVFAAFPDASDAFGSLEKAGRSTFALTTSME